MSTLRQFAITRGVRRWLQTVPRCKVCRKTRLIHYKNATIGKCRKCLMKTATEIYWKISAPDFPTGIKHPDPERVIVHREEWDKVYLKKKDLIEHCAQLSADNDYPIEGFMLYQYHDGFETGCFRIIDMKLVGNHNANVIIDQKKRR